MEAPNPKHLSILKQGVHVWNRWRGDEPHGIPFLESADLPGIDLTGADLNNVDFDGANLRGAVLRHVYGYQAEFFQADMRLANLQDSDLRGAKFHATDLRNALLRATDLYRADFISTLLEGTDFSEACCMTTAFSDVDLKKAVGLEHVKHVGPSNIDIATLMRSRGDRAADFFRSAGVPREVLDYLKALIEPGIEFHSVFISYSTTDQQFANQLYDDLIAAGVRCWFAPHSIQGGKKIYDQVDRAIRLYDKLLLILSDASMTSEWVKTEIANARQREIRENRQMLFPITLVGFEKIRNWKAVDSDTGKDSARDIREYFIPDFSDWTNRAIYTGVFDRLLRDLRAEATSKQINDLS